MNPSKKKRGNCFNHNHREAPISRKKQFFKPKQRKAFVSIRNEERHLFQSKAKSIRLNSKQREAFVPIQNKARR